MSTTDVEKHIFLPQKIQREWHPNSGDLEAMEVLMLKPESVLDAFRSGEIIALSAVAAIALAASLFLTPHKFRQSRFEGHLRNPVRKRARKEG